LITHDWAAAQRHVADWEKEHGRHPALLHALSLHAIGAGRQDDAERYLREYIRVSPDQWQYENLAALYKARGDLDRWQETLEEFLRHEDPGLAYAQVRVKLAEHFMSRKEWKKAEPYAAAAAESWAEWG